MPLSCSDLRHGQWLFSDWVILPSHDQNQGFWTCFVWYQLALQKHGLHCVSITAQPLCIAGPLMSILLREGGLSFAPSLTVVVWLFAYLSWALYEVWMPPKGGTSTDRFLWFHLLSRLATRQCPSLATKGDVTRKTYSFVSGTAGVESLVTLIQGHIHYRITHTTSKYFVPIPLDSVRTRNCSGLNKIGLKSDRLIW